jgi:D-alanyl-D-alanine carboxypeptidase
MGKSPNVKNQIVNKGKFQISKFTLQTKPKTQSIKSQTQLQNPELYHSEILKNQIPNHKQNFNTQIEQNPNVGPTL